MDTLIERTQDYFLDHFGISFDTLVAPIDAAMPSGKSVRGRDVYHTIERARRQDDASLPMGAWEHDLKRADWDKVSSVAIDTLAHQSKDLQIAVWLLEAQINKAGFAGIAPCMLLMQALCERFWDDVHPQAEDGDMEYRANVIRWADKKLLASLRLASLTSSGREREYTWADWEQARRNEQIREQVRPSSERDAIEGAATSDVLAAMASSPTEAHVRRHRMLSDALTAIGALLDTLDERLGREAPSLIELSELLGQIQDFIGAELHKRGVSLAAPAPQPLPASQVPDDGEAGLDDLVFGAEDGPIRDRAHAYARLAQIGDFLMRLEPHSPVPYLVRRATEWGGMNTAQLYQEMFLKLGGQLNIFEMLGLETTQGQSHS